MIIIVIGFSVLASSEMPCLRSFHGDGGTPWWHPGSNSSLYRLCERQSSWYLGPRYQTQMQMLGATLCAATAASPTPNFPPETGQQKLFLCLPSHLHFFPAFLLLKVFCDSCRHQNPLHLSFFFFPVPLLAPHSNEFTQSSSPCCEKNKISPVLITVTY